MPRLAISTSCYARQALAASKPLRLLKSHSSWSSSPPPELFNRWHDARPSESFLLTCNSLTVLPIFCRILSCPRPGNFRLSRFPNTLQIDGTIIYIYFSFEWSYLAYISSLFSALDFRIIILTVSYDYVLLLTVHFCGLPDLDF